MATDDEPQRCSRCLTLRTTTQCGTSPRLSTRWTHSATGRPLCPPCAIADLREFVDGASVIGPRRESHFLVSMACAVSQVRAFERPRFTQILDDDVETALRSALFVETGRPRLPPTVSRAAPRAGTLAFERFDASSASLMSVRWELDVIAVLRPTLRTLQALVRRQRLAARIGGHELTFDVSKARAVVDKQLTP